MRSVAAYLVFVLLMAVSSPAMPNALTIVFRFDGPYSEKSLLEMKRQLGTYCMTRASG